MFSVRFYLLLAMICALLFVPPVFSESGGNIGLTYNQVIDDRSGGLLGEYSYGAEMFDFEIDGDLQFGDIYRAKVHAEVVFGPPAVGIKIATDITGKGYTLDTMGRDQNASIALNIPVRDSGLEVDIGIGGKNASPWGAPNALSDLVPKGYNQTELEALGLDQVFPSPRGLPFLDGSSLNSFIATGFEKGNVEVDVKAILQVTGADKAHQVITHLETSRELFAGIRATIGIEVALMHYQEVIHYETAMMTTFGFAW